MFVVLLKYFINIIGVIQNIFTSFINYNKLLNINNRIFTY